VYWIQAGAFLDHKNAERLAERLRGDGFPATSTLFDQSRVLYRVVVSSQNGDSPGEDVIEKVRTLGFTVERGEAGIAATGLVPLRSALEASRRLRDNGIPVQLRQEVGSATYQVVRVGSFPTAREAEDSLASLKAQGVEGFVVREH
jgi:cell division protein FtsN